REFERQGLGPVPEDDHRLETFIAGFGDYPPTGEEYSARLRAEPELLRFILRFFVVEDAGRWLARHDGLRDGNRWDDSLVALAADGTLSRDRILDGALDAMTLDVRPGLAWFAGLHDKLA